VERQAPAKLVSCEPTAGVAVSVTSLPSKDVKVVPGHVGPQLTAAGDSTPVTAMVPWPLPALFSSIAVAAR